MNNKSIRKIPTRELAEEIKDELDDLYHDGAFTGSAYRKKRSYTKVLKAINSADRTTTRDMNLKVMVVLYIPPDQTSIAFADNYKYVEHYIDSILEKTDLNPANEQFFLGNDPYLNVIEIHSTYLYKFDSYPASGAKSESRLKKVDQSEFYSREDKLRNLESTYFPTQYYEDRKAIETYCYFMPGEQRLIMDAKFSEGAFLQFEGRIMPGLFTAESLTDSEKADEDWDVYKIKAPHWAYELLKYEALLSLVPLSSSAYNLIEARKQRVKRDMEASKPSDSTILTPPHSY